MVFHLGPLAPRPELGHVDTEDTDDADARRRPARTNGAGAHDPARGGHRHRRRRPRRHRRPGVLGPAGRRPYRDPGDHPLRPGRVPFADRRRVRLRPGGPRAGRGTGRPRRPVHPVRAGRRPRRRCATPGSTSSGGPLADRGVPGHRGRRHHPAGARLRRGQRHAGSAGTWTTGRPARICTGRSRPARSPPRSRSRSARTARCRPSRPAAPPGSTRSGTPSTPIEEGRADMCVAGASDSPISPITVACFDAIKATSREQRRPGARLPAVRRRTATGSSWARAGPCSSWRSWNTPAPAARPCYCEIGGYATFGNAYHMTGLTTEGLEMAEAIDHALDQARLDGSRSTTSTRTARAPSRTTGTRRPRSSGRWASTRTTCR